MQFEAWPKIPRHKGVQVVITEKIDGTNACLVVENNKIIGCQSRNRIIDRHSDNAGFANWAFDNEERIVNLLGEGRHFGEWAGPNIQQNKLNLDRKHFFLFNSYLWYEKLNVHEDHGEIKSVPLLYNGDYQDGLIEDIMNRLKYNDFPHQTGYMKPEGIIIFYPQMKSYEKLTFEHTEGKWVDNA